MKKNYISLLSLSLLVATALSMSACGKSRAATASPLTSAGNPTKLDGRWQSGCDPVTAKMTTWNFAGTNFSYTVETYPAGNNCNDDPDSAVGMTGSFTIGNGNDYSNVFGNLTNFSSVNLIFADGTPTAEAAFDLNGNDLTMTEPTWNITAQNSTLMGFTKI